MYRLTWIAKLFLFLLLPSLVFPVDYSLQHYPIPRSSIWNPAQPFSYDDVLELIEQIENDELEHCSPEELDRINQFIVRLAKEGVLPHETTNDIAALNQDIHALLDYSFDGKWYASFDSTADILLCKSWIKKQWDQTRKFVRKHKNEIIIGTVVVVATVTVVVVTCGAGSGAVAGVAGAALGLAGSDENKHPVPETPLLQGVIEDRVTSFKEMISENAAILDDPSFIDRARDFGAYLAHETLDSVQNAASLLTELGQEIRQSAAYFGLDFTLPEGTFPQRDLDGSFFSGHETIDQFFGVTQAPNYTPEARAAEPFIEYTYAVLPPPGALSGTSLLTEGYLAPTQCNATWGWVVGQPIQNKTWWGGVPKWSTVRQRYWKNEAEMAKLDPKHRYRPQISRMEKGLAPLRYNPATQEMESIELHHVPSQKEGGLFDFIEVTAEEHARLDPNRRLGR